MIQAPPGVTLIAVSKQQPEARIAAALAAGQRVFGENRVQEAHGRWAHRREGIDLHLIGPLQTNKVRDALALFDVIHTLDRPKLVRVVKAAGPRRARAFFVQVNTGEEAQKAGCLPQDLPALLHECNGLPVTGFMCIPPVGEPPELHFALLKTLAEAHGLPHLSMGMSADWEAAVALGATHIRLGSAFFGPRAGVKPGA
ncbi:MAG: YggS family pyridoxal phosphate-dependent enzyme [Alphaproteobacteria bacterium]|jgi:pyridoxal phosphate enzyme (YggS family)|nr:YggS family pyridoxal phosphate-dependent enzyme [Alphaproteobacteria bacterium]